MVNFGAGFAALCYIALCGTFTGVAAVAAVAGLVLTVRSNKKLALLETIKGKEAPADKRDIAITPVPIAGPNGNLGASVLMSVSF